jgi:hypothetical protein
MLASEIDPAVIADIVKLANSTAISKIRYFFAHPDCLTPHSDNAEIAGFPEKAKDDEA